MNEIIDIPVPEGVEHPVLRLFFSAGELNLSPGDSDALVQGDVEYSDERFKPRYSSRNAEVTLESAIGKDIMGDLRSLWEQKEHYRNSWNLKLGTMPMDLFLRVGAAKSGVDLGGLSLRKLTIEQGATDFAVDFSSRNLVPMKTLSFSGGASRSVLKGLANTAAEKIEFRSGAGDYILNFSGELTEKMSVTIEAGVGRVVLIVPDSVPAVLTRKGGLTAVNSSGVWKQQERMMWVNRAAGWEGPGAEGSGSAPVIRINATMGLGSLELRNT